MKKSNNKTWKRIAAGALSLALVAGAMPANVGGLLTVGKGIVAHAEGHTYDDLEDLLGDVDSWLLDNDWDLHEADGDAYWALYDAIEAAEDVDQNNEETVNAAYDDLYNAYTAAKAALGVITELEVDGVYDSGSSFDFGDEYVYLKGDAVDDVKRTTGTGTIAFDDGFGDDADCIGLAVSNLQFYNEQWNDASVLVLDKEASIPRSSYTKFKVTGGAGTQQSPFVIAAVAPDQTYEITLPEDEGITVTQNDEAIDDLTAVSGEVTFSSEEPFYLYKNVEEAPVIVGFATLDNEVYSIDAELDSDLSAAYIGEDENGDYVIQVNSAADMELALKFINSGDYDFEMPFIQLTADIDATGGNAIKCGPETSGYENAFATTANVAIDLNGYNLDCGNGNSIYSVGGSLVIDDLSETGDGQLTCDYIAAYGLEANGGGVLSAGRILIAGGHISCTELSADTNSGCSLTISGGSFSSWYDIWNNYLPSEFYSVSRDEQTNLYTVNCTLPEEQDFGSIRRNDITYFNYTIDGEPYTIPKRMLDSLNGEFSIEVGKGEKVTLKTANKSWFEYVNSDGNRVELDDFIETEPADPETYWTYSFTMPGYEVNHGIVSFRIYDETWYDPDPENQDGHDLVSHIKSVTAPKEDTDQYDYNTDIILTADTKLNFCYNNGEEYPVEESFADGVYTYTFKITDEVSVSTYEHEHEYTYRVEGNKLYRKCTLDEDPSLCDEGETGNEELVVAELNNVYVENPSEAPYGEWNDVKDEFDYDGETHKADIKTADDFDEDYEFTYYKLDEAGDRDYEVDAPEDAGTYEAVAVYEIDVNGDERIQKNEIFELSLQYTINPMDFEEWWVQPGTWNEHEFKPAANYDAEIPYAGIGRANYTVGKFEMLPIAGEEQSEASTGGEGDAEFVGLEEGTDYIIDGVAETNVAGKYTFYVVPVGNYAGKPVEVTWTAKNESIELTKDMITVTDVEYDNGYASPVIEIKDANGKTYDSFWLAGVKNANKSGTYTVIVNGSGDLAGSVAVEWTFDAADAMNIRSEESIEDVANNKLRVTVKGTTLAGKVKTTGAIFYRSETLDVELTKETANDTTIFDLSYDGPRFSTTLKDKYDSVYYRSYAILEDGTIKYGEVQHISMTELKQDAVDLYEDESIEDAANKKIRVTIEADADVKAGNVAKTGAVFYRGTECPAELTKEAADNSTIFDLSIDGARFSTTLKDKFNSVYYVGYAILEDGTVIYGEIQHTCIGNIAVELTDEAYVNGETDYADNRLTITAKASIDASIGSIKSTGAIIYRGTDEPATLTKEVADNSTIYDLYAIGDSFRTTLKDKYDSVYYVAYTELDGGIVKYGEMCHVSVSDFEEEFRE